MVNLKNAVLILIVVSSKSFVDGSGEVTFLSSAQNVRFSGKSHVESQMLPSILLAAMGYTPADLDRSWDGLSVLVPFDLPRNLMLVGISGISGIRLEGNRYDVKGPINMARIYSQTLDRMQHHTNLVRNELLLYPKEGPVIETEGLSSLDPELPADRSFLLELEDLEKQIRESSFFSGDHNSVFIHVRSPVGLVSEYGEDSPQVQEAVRLLKDVINRLNAEAGDRTLLAVLTHKPSTRRSRSLLEADAEPVTEDDKARLNIAGAYTDNYSAIFNIILWTSLILAVALVVIADFTANMDPGKDSIIYRMTNPRLKKDA